MRGNFITDRKGINNTNYKHGLSNSRLYKIYNNIKSRCYNSNTPQYKDYGGRGIQLCTQWLRDFTTFYNWSLNNGYEDSLTIDRINVDGNYEPNNCRWVSKSTQSNNKRNNIMFKGETLSVYCRKNNINYRTVKDRLLRGWSIDDAVSKPIEHKYAR